MEVRKQISRLGVGGGAQTLGFQGRPEGEGKGGLGRGGSAPGGKELWLLLSSSWGGPWSVSESESQQGRGGLRHLCPL